MTKRTNPIKPWLSGPSELMQHAMDHLANDSDFDRRVAFISIDNAVEVCIRTYLGLPRRARGSAGPSRRRLEEASSSFPELLDLLEEFAEEGLDGVELGEVEWYHRLRNTLYHDGNGITVDRHLVDAYFQIARLLIGRLLGADPSEVVSAHPTTAIGRFILQWALLEHNVKVLGNEVLAEPNSRFRVLVRELRRAGSIDQSQEEELTDLMVLRVKVVHQPHQASVEEVREAAGRVSHFNGVLMGAFAQAVKRGSGSGAS